MSTRVCKLTPCQASLVIRAYKAVRSAVHMMGTTIDPGLGIHQGDCMPVSKQLLANTNIIFR